LQPDAIAVREALESDLPAVVALVQSAYRGDSSTAGWTTEAHLLDGQRTDVGMLAPVLADPNQAILLFEDADQLRACITVERRADCGYIGMVTVQPTGQSQGMGRRILETAETHIRDEWGFDRAQMTVIAQRTELIVWYERRGYHLTGDIVPFPYDEARFGEPKRSDLYLVVMEKALS
jgi:GNAT superfamily N-acetyltransferase